MSVPKFTVIHPYYEGAAAIATHFGCWAEYPPEFLENLQLIFVDDGSPTQPLEKALPKKTNIDLSAFKIDIDIPWNDGGARNLGAHFAKADWMIMLDLDKRLPVEEMRKLWNMKLDPKCFYKFFHAGPKGSYANQIIINRELYMSLGGYNEDHSGGRGGSGSFFRTLDEAGIEMKVLDLTLRHISAGKVQVLDRRKMSVEEKAAAAGRPVRQPHEPATMLRFPWRQIR